MDIILPRRTKDWHKGLSGHVLIIGGEAGFIGAPRMAGEAALRVGAGLVSIATKPEHAHILNVHFPELMCHGITTPNQLEKLMQKATVVVLGPGLGQTDWSLTLWQCALTSSLPMVIDADALNLLSQHHMHRSHWVLTPHPGEAARLLKQPVEIIQQDRLQAACALQRQYGGVSVLKGAGSVVASDQGEPFVCERGNPGMATAGMGDILSGVIGGCLAQGLPLSAAAKYSVYIHAVAGDLAAAKGERGLVATDLLPFLRQLVN